ncbi:PREDICTED: 5'-nucleotidase domain-containing protein 1-like [Wasmannia auropunctata]|uniref:5'-nucleotidase domain-containing protein 1-like n=1 Tax=Wasmannia auropunctata TaxID=64793 RepID=UPI0005F03A3B|nr:PREDICTED: 5'-nucleotidase domain-containing protein 1-like [Wasmannia auropunctata]XP_011706575.1 PREDICTED: 5'-nucleotidase domain-containing protein 1-like [Wasmannia auropunctata]
MIRDLGLYRRTVRLCARRHSALRKRVTNKVEIPVDTTARAVSNGRYNDSTASSGGPRSDMDAFRFTDYDCVGFDLDNTLLRFNVTNLVCMEYEMLAEFLVDKRGYSGALLRPLSDDDLDFMQKGLLLDLERGNVLRVSPDGVIRRACHGTRLLNVDQIRQAYPGQRWDVTDTFCRDLISTWNGPLSLKVRSLLDYFDIMTSVAFARAVDALDEERGSPLDRYNIWPDLLAGLMHMFSREHFQSDRGIFGHVKRNPDKYLRKCCSTTISWLKEVKKRSATFLLTGSNADFASFTASYALGEDWRSLFDVVVCYAKKPGFFIFNRPFFDVVNNNETDIVTQGLRRGEMYSQGNWNDLSEFLARITGKTNQRCLYIGDNLIQDIYVPNALARFDTLAVVEEQMSEGMLHHALTHPDEKVLNSKLWGSYFCLKDSTVNVDSIWGHIIKKHAKLCIPNISLVTQRSLEEPIPCFDKDGKLYRGYYPAIPLSVSAM